MSKGNVLEKGEKEVKPEDISLLQEIRDRVFNSAPSIFYHETGAKLNSFTSFGNLRDGREVVYTKPLNYVILVKDYDDRGFPKYNKTNILKGKSFNWLLRKTELTLQEEIVKEAKRKHKYFQAWTRFRT